MTDFTTKLEEILEDNYDPDTEHLYIHKIKDEIKILFSETVLKAIGEIEMEVAKCENIELPGYPDTYIKMADVLHILDKANIEKELGIKEGGK